MLSLLGSTDSLPSWIQQPSIQHGYSVALWRADTKHIQATSSFAELPSCILLFIFCPLGSWELKPSRGTTCRGSWMQVSCAFLWKTWSWKQNFVLLLLRCFILDIGWNSQSSQRFSSSLSFLSVLTCCSSKTQYHFSLILWVCLRVE